MRKTIEKIQNKLLTLNVINQKERKAREKQHPSNVEQTAYGSKEMVGNAWNKAYTEFPIDGGLRDET